MGPPYDTLELASFVTASKGWAAECGARAALVEIPRLEPLARASFEAGRARAHCPSVLGQCVLDCIVSIPRNNASRTGPHTDTAPSKLGETRESGENSVCR